MTKTCAILLLLVSTVGLAQEVDHKGIYYWEINPTNAGKHTRKLTIKADGTFTFNRNREAYKRNLESDINGRGTWTSKGKYIYFTTNPETEIDDTYTLNFTNTKGRWDTRKNRLILYESDIFWLDKFAIDRQSN